MEKALQSYAAGDYQQALEIWLLSAYDGNPEGQYRLGTMFAQGTGTVADLSEAAYWFTRAAEQGHTDAQFELGKALFHGTGVSPDKSRAVEWWHVAAENGSTEAQYHLGRAYFYGIDLEQDATRAMEWFTRAAENGDELAIKFLERVGTTNTGSATPASDWTGYGRISDRAVWVYASFNRMSPILQRLEPGALLRVNERRSGWFRVQIPGGLPVWVPADKIAEVEDGHRIVGVGVQARADPDNDPGVDPVGMFLDGDRVIPIQSKEGWMRVQAPESISGWVEAIDVVELGEDDNAVAAQWRTAREVVRARAVAMTSGRTTVVLASVRDSGETAFEATEGDPVVATASGDAAEEPAPESSVSSGIAIEVAALVAESTMPAEQDGNEAEGAGRQSGLPLDEIGIGAPVDATRISAGDYLRVGRRSQSVYSENRLSSARIELMPPGLLLRVVEVNADWVRVEVPGGLPLWIFSRFIEHDGNMGRITAEGVRARPLPSTSSNSQPVGVYAEGASVRVITESDQWIRIHAPEAISAWMRIDGLHHVEADAAAIADLWSEQGADGVIALNGLVVSDVERVVQSNGVIDGEQAAPVDPRTAARESAASTVRFGRQETATESTGAQVTPVEVAQVSTDVQPADDATEPPTPEDGGTAVVQPSVEVVTEVVAEEVTETAAEEAVAEVADLTVQAEPVQAEPVQAEPVQAEPVQAEPVQAEPVQAEPVQEERVVAEAEVAEPESGSDDRSTEALVITEPEVIVVDTGAVDVRPEPPFDTSVPVIQDASTDTTPVVEPLHEESTQAPVDAADDAQVSSTQPLPTQPSSTQPSSTEPSSTEMGQTTDDTSLEQPTVEATPGDVETEEVADLADTESSPADEAIDDTSSDATPLDVDEVVTGEIDPMPADAAPGEPGDAVDAAADQLAGTDTSTSGPVDDPEVDAETPATASGEDSQPADASPTEESVAAVAPVQEAHEGNAATESAGQAPVDSTTAEPAMPEVADDESSGVPEDAVVTPSPAPVDTSGGVRFDDLLWLYQQSPDAFSIEVLRDAQREAVVQAGALMPEANNAYSFSTQALNTVVYNLMVGAYPNLIDVQQSLGALQPHFDTIRIRRLGAVQRQWCDQIDNLTPEQLMLVLDRCAR